MGTESLIIVRATRGSSVRSPAARVAEPLGKPRPLQDYMSLVPFELDSALVIPSTDRPVHFTLWTLVVTIVVPTVLLFVLYRIYGRKASACEHVRVITFANHKGGVGKTTICVFAAKDLASKNPDKNILVLDLSVYRDLTASVVGDTGFDRPKVTVQRPVCSPLSASSLTPCSSPRVCAD